MVARPNEVKVKNQALIDARLRLESPSGSGEPLSTQEVAEGMNAYLWLEHLKVKGSRQPTILDHRFVSAYEAGRSRWPSKHYRAAFRAVLQAATDVELGFHPQRKRRTRPPDAKVTASGLDIDQPVRDTHAVHRRTLVTLLAGLAARQAVDRVGLAQLVAGADLFESGTSLEEHWHSVASEYGHAYLSRPRPQTARDLTIDLAILELALPRAESDVAKRSMYDAGARIAALLAMACTDLGYSPEARHAWLLARRMSNASENLNVQLWVRGQEALLGIYSGRPLHIIEHLTATSLEAAGDVRSPGKADLLAAQAEVFALQGRAAEALVALADLNRVFDVLPPPHVVDVNSAYSWPEHRLRHTESFVYSIVGSARDAAYAQDLAVNLYPASRTVSRCQIEMHRSVFLVRTGEISAGIRHAASELEDLAPGRRGRFVLAVADHVATAIPTAEARNPEARDFLAYLTALQYPTA